MKIYDKLDEGIMYGVNKVLRAWNWTTGGTKANLANGMLTIAPIFESVGYFNNGPFIGLFSPVVMLMSYIHQQQFKKVEEREIRALEAGAKDMYAERFKEFAPINAVVWGMNSAVWGFKQGDDGKIISDSTYTNYSTAFGNGIRAASFYVMRGDILPPKKNCISRGVDKLAEIVESYRPQPAFVPFHASDFTGIERIIS